MTTTSARAGRQELSREDGMTAGYTFRHVVRMEWVKLRSLRSVTWTLALGMLAMVVLAVVTGWNTRSQDADVANNVLDGLIIGQVVTAILGVLAITGEFGSGSIKATLAAVPRRGLVLAAKIAVWGATFLIVGEIAVVASFLLGVAAVHHGVPHPSLATLDVLRAVLMSGAYLALIGLTGLGIGALARSGAAASAIVVAALFALPMIIAAPQHSLGKYMPELIAANSLSTTIPVQGFTWSPWAELGVVTLYPLVLLLAGGWLLNRRDV
jgi:hypothetical protein